MTSRLLFILIAAFWVVMNVLLWRSEFSRGRHDSPVPVRMVISKILNTPDTSTLNVMHQGSLLGWVKWAVSVEESSSSDGQTIEGMVRNPSRFLIDLEGNVLIPALRQRSSFYSTLTYSTNNSWEALSLRVHLKPFQFSIESRLEDQAVLFWMDDGGEKVEKRFTFTQLRQPDQMIKELELGEFQLVLSSVLMGLPAADRSSGKMLEWNAFSDWATIAGEKVRAYRLEAKLVDRHRIVIFVGRMGEIIRVELPNGVILENDRVNPFG